MIIVRVVLTSLSGLVEGMVHMILRSLDNIQGLSELVFDFIGASAEFVKKAADRPGHIGKLVGPDQDERDDANDDHYSEADAEDMFSV